MRAVTTKQRFLVKDIDDDEETLMSSLVPLEQDTQKVAGRQKSPPCRAAMAVFLSMAFMILLLLWSPRMTLVIVASTCVTLCFVTWFKVRQVEQPTRVKAIAFHDHLPWLLVTHYSGRIELWNRNNGTPIPGATCFASDQPIRACQFIESGNMVAVAGDDRHVHIFDLRQNENETKLQMRFSFEAHSDYIRSLASSSSNPPILLSCSDDKTIKLWDIEAGWACGRVYEGHDDYVMMVKINPQEPDTFASASLDGTIRFWNIHQEEALFALHGHQMGVNCLDFCSSSNSSTVPATEPLPLLASGGDDRAILIWNYQTRQIVTQLKGHLHNVTAVLFPPSLPILVSTSEDGKVQCWSISSDQKPVFTTSGDSLLLRPGGRGWALAGIDRKLAIGLDEGCVCIDL